MSSVILGQMLITTGLQAWLRSAKREASGRPSFPRVETMSSSLAGLKHAVVLQYGDLLIAVVSLRKTKAQTESPMSTS